MFGADGASTDVVCDVCTSARSVECLSCLCLHLLHPLMDSVQVRKGMVKEF